MEVEQKKPYSQPWTFERIPGEDANYVNIHNEDGLMIENVFIEDAEYIVKLHNDSLAGNFPVPLWTSEHVRVYDYNRYGTVCFSGLAEQWPPVDVTKMLADERRKVTVVVYLED